MTDDEWEDLVGGEWLDWYRLSPAESWRISNTELWATFLALGGRLDDPIDTQSPFFDWESMTMDTAETRK